MEKTKRKKKFCKISMSSTHVNVAGQDNFVHPEAKICTGELFAKPATMWVVWINALGWSSSLPPQRH